MASVEWLREHRELAYLRAAANVRRRKRSQRHTKKQRFSPVERRAYLGERDEKLRQVGL